MIPLGMGIGLDWRVRRPGHWGFGWQLFCFRLVYSLASIGIPGLDMAIHLYPVLLLSSYGRLLRDGGLLDGLFRQAGGS